MTDPRTISRVVSDPRQNLSGRELGRICNSVEKNKMQFRFGNVWLVKMTPTVFIICAECNIWQDLAYGDAEEIMM
jgi:hypothetical protein